MQEASIESIPAVVLAAGKGQRLRSIVDKVPKPMVQVNGVPVLEHNLMWLRDAGIDEVYINLHHLPHVVTDYLGDGTRLGIEISYSLEPELLGTAGAVRRIASELWAEKTPSTFVVVYGDNILSDFDLSAIVDFHRSKGGIGTVCLYHKDDVSQSGIAVLDDDGAVIRFVEKPTPAQAVSDLVNTGIYVLQSDVLNYIPEGVSDFGHDVFPEILQSGGRLFGMVTDANLIAIDTPELLARATKNGGQG